MSNLREVVGGFIAQREEYVGALKRSIEAGADYHRWSGHAEARRQLGDKLKAASIDLTAEPRDEATVKAEALREAATAARAEAANSRTNNGRCESESLADWLDDRAAAIDPARLEGAHP